MRGFKTPLIGNPEDGSLKRPVKEKGRINIEDVFVGYGDKFTADLSPSNKAVRSGMRAAFLFI
ncbi:MAG: hypothetical protein ACLFQB_09855 [Chitinispirillaceae bacterium]